MKPVILTDYQCDILRRAVALRDNYCCILHPTRPGGGIHHIIHKSYTSKNHPLIWQMKNMCLLCTECHPGEAHRHPLIMRDKLLRKMMELYNIEYGKPFSEYLIEKGE